MRVIFLLAAPLFTIAIAASAAESADAIVAKSVMMTEGDWNEAPHYAFIDRAVVVKNGHRRPTQTDQVLMIDGSPYNELIATNDAPLSKQEQEIQAPKLARETARRMHESADDRQRRIESYSRERMQDHAMLSEMVKAFEFSLTGEDMLDGHKVWVLKTTPKRSYVPHNREGRVLQHMEGRMWIDQSTYRWVKVEAHVMKAVSMYGFLAKVKPGTRFELEQGPVGSARWMPKKFVVTVRATALGIKNENSYEEDDYRDYRLEAKNAAQATTANRQGR